MDVIHSIISNVLSRMSPRQKVFWSMYGLVICTLVVFGNKTPYINVLLPIFSSFLIFITIFLLCVQFKRIKWIVFILSFPLLAFFYLTASPNFVWSLLLLLFSFPNFQLTTVKKILDVFLPPIPKIIHRYWKSALIFSVICIVLIQYGASLHSYFEGDEWVFFRFYAPAVASKTWFVQGFINTFLNQKDLNVHMSPIANMIYVIQYKLFGLNFQPYLLFSLISHSISSLLLGWLVYIYTKKRTLTFTTVLLFAGAVTHSQAMTWVVASVYTQFSVAFGLLSLIFLKKFSLNNQQKHFILSLIFLLFALWSKETALPFLIIYPFLMSKKSAKKIFSFLLICVIFVYTQLPLLTHALSNSSTISQPLLYSIVSFWEQRKLDLFSLRIVTFFFKILTQSLIPASTIMNLGAWLSDYLFPFFTAEKSVRGTNYLMFIQSAAPEFLSLGIGASILTFWKLKSKEYIQETKFHRVAQWMIILGLLPILAVILRFPWWAYTAFIDSRHLYHITPFVAFLLAEIVITISQKLSNLHHISTKVFVSLFLLLALVIQYPILQKQIITQSKDSSFPSRKMIVETLQAEISPVPEKLILYTTSNKSYYGFAQWMLPFQTAVSHMLPVIFADQYHPQGQMYPASFFNQEYLKNVKGGLVTQGYFEDQGKGLGYFLEDQLLIKTMEEKQLPIDSLYAFNFDGDENTFTNITNQKRAQIKDILDSRKIFQNWSTYKNESWYIVFSHPATWDIQTHENSLSLSDDFSQNILTITVYEDMSAVNFSQFVSEQHIDGRILGDKMKSFNLSPDLDLTRIAYHPDWDEKHFFIAGGNGRTLYEFKLSPNKKAEAELVLRTLDLID